MPIEIRYHLTYDEADLLLNVMKGRKPFERLDVEVLVDMIARLESLIAKHSESRERINRRNRLIAELTNQTEPTRTVPRTVEPDATVTEDLARAAANRLASDAAKRGTDEPAE